MQNLNERIMATTSRAVNESMGTWDNGESGPQKTGLGWIMMS